MRWFLLRLFSVIYNKQGKQVAKHRSGVKWFASRKQTGIIWRSEMMRMKYSIYICVSIHYKKFKHFMAMTTEIWNLPSTKLIKINIFLRCHFKEEKTIFSEIRWWDVFKKSAGGFSFDIPTQYKTKNIKYCIISIEYVINIY